jgi:hypothetical protein
MKKRILFPVTIGISFLLFYACKNKDEETKAQDDNIDVASTFIRSALDGKFDEARTLLLPDSLNEQYLDAAERSFQRSDPDTRYGYKNASIRIHNINKVNDSTTIVIFSNSYKNDHDTLKVLKVKDRWLVDLKYLYLHDMDSIPANPNNKDSLP